MKSRCTGGREDESRQISLIIQVLTDLANGSRPSELLARIGSHLTERAFLDLGKPAGANAVTREAALALHLAASLVRDEELGCMDWILLSSAGSQRILREQQVRPQMVV